jgi:hypothetical protein
MDAFRAFSWQSLPMGYLLISPFPIIPSQTEGKFSASPILCTYGTIVSSYGSGRDFPPNALMRKEISPLAAV